MKAIKPMIEKYPTLEDFIWALDEIDEKNYFRQWRAGERFVHRWSPDLFFRTKEEATEFYNSIKSDLE